MQPRSGRRLLEFEPDRRGQQLGETEFRSAAALSEELPHQRTDQPVSVARAVYADAEDGLRPVDALRGAGEQGAREVPRVLSGALGGDDPVGKEPRQKANCKRQKAK